jgi:hypothetical protein
MKRILTLTAALLASACTTGGATVATYQERENVDVCLTTITPDVDVATRRPLGWRYHRCGNPNQTINAGLHVSPSVIEVGVGVLGNIAGPVIGGKIIGKEIGPSGHAAPNTLTIRQEPR